LISRSRKGPQLVGVQRVEKDEFEAAGGEDRLDARIRRRVLRGLADPDDVAAGDGRDFARGDRAMSAEAEPSARKRIDGEERRVGSATKNVAPLPG